MTYNFGTSSVDVYAGVDKTDAEAVQAQLDANAAEKTAEAEREAARIAAMSA
jgi:regulator of protease activity HflC (stomatin/prohibitin superfamily)